MVTALETVRKPTAAGVDKGTEGETNEKIHSNK